MIRKIVAIVIFGLAFWVFFIDELYRLESYEWIPDIVGPLLIVVSMYVWNPKWLKKCEPESNQPPDDSHPADPKVS